MGELPTKEIKVRGQDLDGLPVAVTYCMGSVQAAARAVETAGKQLGWAREIEAEGWEPPPWGEGWRANWRGLDSGKPVVDRILAGWVPPALDQVVKRGEVSEQEYHQAFDAFVAAAAEVFVEVAVHGDVWPGRLEDQTHYQRCRVGHFPDQAAAKVPAAREALTRYSLCFLSLAGRLRGARFIPGVFA